MVFAKKQDSEKVALRRSRTGHKSQKNLDSEKVAWPQLAQNLKSVLMGAIDTETRFPTFSSSSRTLFHLYSAASCLFLYPTRNSRTTWAPESLFKNRYPAQGAGDM